MKHLLICIVILAIWSCKPQTRKTYRSNECHDPVDLEREVYKSHGIKTTTYYKEYNGNRQKHMVINYNDEGYPTEHLYFQEEMLYQIDLNEYDSLNRVIQSTTLNGQNDTMHHQTFTRDDSSNKLTIQNYQNDTISNITIFYSDQFGNDSISETYKNDILQFTNRMYWSNQCELDSIISFDTLGKRTGNYTIQNYEGGRLKLLSYYQNNKLKKETETHYNSQGLITKIFYTEIGNYTDTCLIDYAHNLAYKLSITSSLPEKNDTYQDNYALVLHHER